MKQIRNGVFETNSSSTHSICITKGSYTLPNYPISFNIGEFGWEFATLEDYEKYNYLYTALVSQERDSDIELLKTILDKHKVDYVFAEPVYYDYDSGRRCLKEGYIDHCSDLSEFLDDVMSDEDKLLRYLFSSDSFIWTGNDNVYDYDDYPQHEEITYPHEMYYK